MVFGDDLNFFKWVEWKKRIIIEFSIFFGGSDLENERKTLILIFDQSSKVLLRFA